MALTCVVAVVADAGTLYITIRYNAFMIHLLFHSEYNTQITALTDV